MNLVRALSLIQRQVETYAHAAPAGLRIHSLCAKVYWEIDRLTRGVGNDSELASALKAFGCATEELFRLCHVPGRHGIEAAKQQQADALAAVQAIITERELEEAD